MRPRAVLGLLLTLPVLALAACGSDDNNDNNATAAASKPAAAAAPKKITIAYQAIPNGDLVVKHEGWLEEALPDTEIEWKLFDSGGSVNEAVAARSVDIGLAGSSPVSRGLSQPLPYEVPWIHDVIGEAEALVVKKDITSIEQLKGKKVATPLASTAALLAAGRAAGPPAHRQGRQGHRRRARRHRRRLEPRGHRRRLRLEPQPRQADAGRRPRAGQQRRAGQGGQDDL